MSQIVVHREGFTASDLCKVAFAYHKTGIRDKLLTAIAEAKAKEALLQGDIAVELLALVVETFTATRMMTR